MASYYETDGDPRSFLDFFDPGPPRLPGLLIWIVAPMILILSAAFASGQDIEPYRSATVRVQVKYPGGAGSGSGVCVTPQGHILSVKHVFTGKGDIDVACVFRDGRTPSAEIVWPGQQSEDVVVLLCDGEGYPTVPVLSESRTIGDGLPAFAMGYPAGNYTLSECTITGGGFVQEGGDRVAYIHVDFMAHPGYSGGPLFLQDGHLTGICSASNWNAPKRGQASDFLPSSRVRAACDAAGIGDVYQKAGNRKDVRPKQKSPTVVAFGADWCKPCRQFKADHAAGKFGDLKFTKVNQVNGEWDRPELIREYRQATGKGIEGLPTFWVRGTKRYTSGYSGRGPLLTFLRGVLSIPKAVFDSIISGGSEPEPISPQPTPDLGQGKREPDESEPEWTAVEIYAVASSDAPKLARMLAGPVSRKLEGISENMVVHLVGEEETPKRYEAFIEAANVVPDPVYVMAVIRRQGLGLIKGMAAARIEAKAEGKLKEVLAEFDVPARIEVLFERRHPEMAEAVRQAVQVRESDEYQRGEDVPPTKDVSRRELAEEVAELVAPRVIDKLPKPVGDIADKLAEIRAKQDEGEDDGKPWFLRLAAMLLTALLGERAGSATMAFRAIRKVRGIIG